MLQRTQTWLLCLCKAKQVQPKIVTKYIGRYLGRPVIATSRIDRYDGETVTFHYNRHEDNRLITESVPVMEFIQRLIQHIPKKTFQADPILWPICRKS